MGNEDNDALDEEEHLERDLDVLQHMLSLAYSSTALALVTILVHAPV